MSRYYSRKKTVPINENKNEKVEIDYKDLVLLKKYLSETFKIVPSRVTGVKSKYQRTLSSAIKRARILALLPYCDQH